jgi:murein DD-endopeptidase MepM/ murein hydrolase activator NlpD
MMIFKTLKHPICGLFLMMLLVGCATQPTRNDRIGLLDRGSGGSRSRYASGDASEFESRPDVNEKLELVGEWQWPVRSVEISSEFGQRGRKFHQGIDFRALVGTPVYAASNGKVVYVGSKIRGYGRMVVLRHDGNLYSVYAHHSKNLVKSGEEVFRGQQIAFSGRSGRVSGPHLHFEVRKGVHNYDPGLAITEHLKTSGSRQQVFINAGSQSKTRRVATTSKKKSPSKISRRPANRNRKVSNGNAQHKNYQVNKI